MDQSGLSKTIALGTSAAPESLVFPDKRSRNRQKTSGTYILPTVATRTAVKNLWRTCERAVIAEDLYSLHVQVAVNAPGQLDVWRTGSSPATVYRLVDR